MALKEAQNKAAKYSDVDTWNKKGNLKGGEKIEGYYIDREKFDTKFGEMTTIIIKDSEGKLYKLVGQSDIKNKFIEIPLGSKVVVEYEGIVETDRGTKRGYKVQYDDEDKIEVENANV